MLAYYEICPFTANYESVKCRAPGEIAKSWGIHAAVMSVVVNFLHIRDFSAMHVQIIFYTGILV